ncbi:MAG: F0F1 ATP synthase subunit gamma, partial [Terriglobales bacterium]
MPNLLDIRRRIRSVKNTQQITSAMKMVSAAKLRRAQEQALAARPYAQQLYALMGGLAAYLDPQDLADARLPGADWPLAALLDRRPVHRRLLVVIATDSGLVGAFNANALKAAHAAGEGAETQILAVGRKARDFYRRRQATLLAGHVGQFQHGVDHELARQVATEAMQAYATGAVDEVVVVGNEFKSVLQQVVVRRRLLPLQLEPPAASGTPGA